VLVALRAIDAQPPSDSKRGGGAGVATAGNTTTSAPPGASGTAGASSSATAPAVGTQASAAAASATKVRKFALRDADAASQSLACVVSCGARSSCSLTIRDHLLQLKLTHNHHVMSPSEMAEMQERMAALASAPPEWLNAAKNSPIVAVALSSIGEKVRARMPFSRFGVS